MSGLTLIAWLCLWHASLAAAASPAHLGWSRCTPSTETTTSAATQTCAWLTTGTHMADAPVRLRVTRLQRFPDRASPHPIVFVPGGPGDPAGQTGVALQTWRRFQQQAGWSRDLVLYDPRGTGQSRPRVGCPSDTLTAGKPLVACHDALGATLVEHLGVDAQVADLHRLIERLNQGPAVLWAHSFGAQIALRLAAAHPRDIQGVILESPALSIGMPGQRSRRAMQAVVDRLIARCANRPRCALASPSLRSIIGGWLTRLRQAPWVVETARPPYRSQSVRVDAAGLLGALLLASYGPDQDARISSALRRSLADRQALGAVVAPLARLNEATPARTPAYWSARCGVPLTAPDGPHLAGSAPRLDIGRYLDAPTDPCRHWPVPRSRLAASLPAGRPGIVITGTDDVLLTRRPARAFVAGHPAVVGLTVEGGRHELLLHSACAREAVDTWLDGLAADTSARPLSLTCEN